MCVSKFTRYVYPCRSIELGGGGPCASFIVLVIILVCTTFVVSTGSKNTCNNLTWIAVVFVDIVVPCFKSATGARALLLVLLISSICFRTVWQIIVIVSDKGLGERERERERSVVWDNDVDCLRLALAATALWRHGTLYTGFLGRWLVGIEVDWAN